MEKAKILDPLGSFCFIWYWNSFNDLCLMDKMFSFILLTSIFLPIIGNSLSKSNPMGKLENMSQLQLDKVFF